MKPIKVKHYKTRKIFDEVEPIINGRIIAVMEISGKCDVQHTGNLTPSEQARINNIIRKHTY